MINAFHRSSKRFKLMRSVKRRRAMLASNPLRNSRPELIANDGQDMFLSGLSYTLVPARPESGIRTQG
jgi:hypothetical protein